MYLNVREVNQMASGGSYVIIFDATVDLQLGSPEIAVTIETIDPPDSDLNDIELVREAIGRGVERILGESARGATVRVHRLVINSTDLKPWRFEQFTAFRLRQLLEGQLDGAK